MKSICISSVMKKNVNTMFNIRFQHINEVKPSDAFSIMNVWPDKKKLVKLELLTAAGSYLFGFDLIRICSSGTICISPPTAKHKSLSALRLLE